MTIGIIPNTSKADILKIVTQLIDKLNSAGINFLISENLIAQKKDFNASLNNAKYLPQNEMIKNSDMVISIGGDGTMLNTAYEVRNYSTPILGVNYGKLGFLAEFDLDTLNEFLKEIRNNNFIIEERMALVGKEKSEIKNNLYAINDIVIEKGPWHKMIEITVKIDDDYVSTFSADGIILATPTGSTGYSLSTGGPIVSPTADVITLSPIAPHSLTMRPLVIPSSQKVTVMVHSLHGKVQISCDGQRSYTYDSPAEITIVKSKEPVRLVHSNKMDYFQTLRNKLFWGLDIRLTNNNKNSK